MKTINMDKVEKRIPNIFQSNHASNLLPLPNGDILCAWFGGSKEGKPDVYILMSRLEKNSNEWTTPIVLSGDNSRSEQNPVVFLAPDSKIWLLYTAQDTYQYTSVVRYRISEDNGYTWSDIRTLFDKPGSFIRQPIVLLDNGDWLLPMYYSLKTDGTSWYGHDYSVVKISSDEGNTWSEYEVPKSRGLVHMNVLKMSDGSLIAFFRSRWADWIYASRSIDNGRTWDVPKPTSLPNNNSSIQITVLNNGKLALVFNNICSNYYTTESNTPEWMDDTNDRIEGFQTRTAVWGTPRVPLTVALSEDGGITWPYMRNLESSDSECQNGSSEEKIRSEYSYPSIKQTLDDKIHITYTYLRDFIKYVSITEDWIKKG